MKIQKAVILAAGRGTRMRELTAELPKPMIEVRRKPVLQHIVEGLSDAGIRDCLVVVGYRADAVQNFFGDGSRYNVAIQYKTQTVQDGTGRVVELARDFVTNRPFILAYGDILIDLTNYKRVVNLPDDVEALLTVTRGEDVTKGGAVFVNEQMELVDIREKVQPVAGIGDAGSRDHRSRLQLPNCFPAYDCPHRAAFEFPVVEWRIARDRLKLIDSDCPLKFRIDQGYVSWRADR